MQVQVFSDTSGLVGVSPGLLAVTVSVSFLSPVPLALIVHLTKEGMIERSM